MTRPLLADCFVSVDTYLADCRSHWWHGVAFGATFVGAIFFGLAWAKGWW